MATTTDDQIKIDFDQIENYQSLCNKSLQSIGKSFTAIATQYRYLVKNGGLQGTADGKAIQESLRSTVKKAKIRAKKVEDRRNELDKAITADTQKAYQQLMKGHAELEARVAKLEQAQD